MHIALCARDRRTAGLGTDTHCRECRSFIWSSEVTRTVLKYIHYTVLYPNMRPEIAYVQWKLPLTLK